MFKTCFFYILTLIICSLTVVLKVKLSEDLCMGGETTGVIPVTLLLEGGTSSSDINVVMIPYDSLSAEGKGIILYCTY